VTQTSIPAAHDVVVIGAGDASKAATDELRTAGITDVLVLDDASQAVFDDDAHNWAVRTDAGETVRARVVIDASRSVVVPWIPEFAGRGEFRGVSFHAAQWDPDFDPAGKHVAVIGSDSTAGHYLARLTESAASVTVFAHAPRRLVTEVPLPATRVRRWLARHIRRTQSDDAPTLVGSAITAITASGLHTADGADHRADAIIYGTGCTVADRIPELVGAAGVTIEEAWDDGIEPFLGIALHGSPNYFFVTGPDLGTQARYVARCLGLMDKSGATRIEVRRSSQQVFNERAHLAPAPPFRVRSAFDLSSAAAPGTQTYDGEATLTFAGRAHPVRVRLSGHLDPIDGHYHWQGTVFSSPAQPLPDEVLKQARTATLTVGERTAPARITEQTPWGTHSVAGVGAPPYALTGR
jgi:cation diffusion facilitator CzcD-associated flavoprotein CzcO